MEFFEDGEDIVSFWEPGLNYQSWLNTLHGGIQATLLDETAGWYVTRKMQTAGVTSAMNVRYRHNVPAGPGVKLEIRVRLKEMRRNLVVLQGSISHEGQVCTTAEMTYFTFPQERARSPISSSAAANSRKTRSKSGLRCQTPSGKACRISGAAECREICFPNQRSCQPE